MTSPEHTPRRRLRRPRHLLARLAGAQPDVLRKARTDRVKYTAMGGVLLTTSGVAAVSATFALNSTLNLALPVAITAGLAWGLVILNLDRMLIVSITRQSGWLRNLSAAVPRLLLAFVIGSIVSVPLVLRIFQPEINGELQVLHAENLIAAQEKLDQQYADIGPMQQKVDNLQAIASGQAQPSVADDPDVKAAQSRVDIAQAAFDKADAAAQCELNGTCGTGQRGVGEAYRQAKAKADAAKAELDAANAALNDATAKARAKISDGTASNMQAAKDELATLKPRLEKRKAEREQAQARLDSGELNSEGLLARLEALDRLTAGSANMRLANYALLSLFLLIEVLPVLVKLLSLVGKESLYDRVLAKDEETLTKRSNHRNDVALAIEEDLKDQQVEQGKEVNKLLVAKQTEIAKKAIEMWGEIATSRSDDELARWYARHSGQAAAAPAPPATTVPLSVTMPLTAPTPPPQPPSSPPTTPIPVVPFGPRPASPGGARGYRQFKQDVGVPRHNNGGPVQYP